MNKKKIFISVGHGGSDPGARGFGFIEAELTLAVAKKLDAKLKRHGVQTLMSRYKNENDPVSAEAAECNAFNPYLSVSIHVNAGGGDGFEVFHSVGGGVGKTLAQNINREVIAIGQNSRGVKTRRNSRGGDYYAYIRTTNCPAVITEMAFIDNAKDMQLFDTDAELDRYATALAKGTLATIGVKYIEEHQNVPEENQNTEVIDMGSIVLYKGEFDGFLANWVGCNMGIPVQKVGPSTNVNNYSEVICIGYSAKDYPKCTILLTGANRYLTFKAVSDYINK